MQSIRPQRMLSNRGPSGPLSYLPTIRSEPGSAVRANDNFSKRSEEPRSCLSDSSERVLRRVVGLHNCRPRERSWSESFGHFCDSKVSWCFREKMDSRLRGNDNTGGIDPPRRVTMQEIQNPEHCSGFCENQKEWVNGEHGRRRTRQQPYQPQQRQPPEQQ